MKRAIAQAVVLSGGSEIVSLAVAEALHRAEIPYSVAALEPRGLLRGAPGCVDYAYMGPSTASPEKLKGRLLHLLCDWMSGSDRKLVVFPTEDGGLRLLNEYRDEIFPYAEFARARNLRMGGLDKAELFAYLGKSSAANWLAPTLILSDEAEADLAFERFGGDVVFKPSIKPWGMNLGPMTGKIVTRSDAGESISAVRKRLRQAWYLSDRWLAQPRLLNYPDGEHGAWSLRGKSVSTVQFVERWKYPAHGGSGCWVETINDRDLVNAADELLTALDFVGMAELPFLHDENGLPQLLELNPRPWLQVGLAEHCGFAIVAGAFAALRSEDVRSPIPDDASAGWVNLERLLLSIASGDSGSRLDACRRFGSALAKRPTVAVYSTGFPFVRRRWMGRMVRSAWTHLARPNSR